jgi:hypothetical protein
MKHHFSTIKSFLLCIYSSFCGVISQKKAPKLFALISSALQNQELHEKN